jgi:hypothetical protein
VHLIWLEQIKRKKYEQLLSRRKYNEIAMRAARIETKTNLLFSFEKMVTTGCYKTPAGAKDFAKGLYDYVYGSENVLPFNILFGFLVVNFSGV